MRYLLRFNYSSALFSLDALFSRNSFPAILLLRVSPATRNYFATFLHASVSRLKKDHNA